MMLLRGDVKHEIIMEKIRSKSPSGAASFVARFEAFLGLTSFIVFPDRSAGLVGAFASLQERTAALQIRLLPHLWRLRKML